MKAYDRKEDSDTASGSSSELFLTFSIAQFPLTRNGTGAGNMARDYAHPMTAPRAEDFWTGTCRQKFI